MTVEDARLASVRAAQDRGTLVAVVAVGLAVAGVVASVWRPLAPAVAAAATDLDVFAPAVLETARAYRGPWLTAVPVSLALTVVVPLLLAATARGRRVVGGLAGPRAHAPVRAGGVAVVVVAVTDLAQLPLALWVGYVHDGRWGFRTQGLDGWFRDWALTRGLSYLVVFVAAVLFAWAVARWPRSWPWRLTVAGTALTAVVVLVQPLVVEPLLLDTTPMQAGPTRDRLEQVLDRAGMSDVEVLVGDASRRTTKVNAFVAGLGPTRRVVVHDTLLALPDDQVATVVAHEVAHRQHRDIARGVLLTAAGLLVGLLLLRGVLDRSGWAATVGARTPSDPRLMALVVLLVAVGQLAAQPVANLVSRRAEAAADHRAMQLTRAPDQLVRTSRVFTVRDLALPDPPGWSVLLWGTHPSVRERIHAGVQFAARHELPLPHLEELRAAEHDLRHPAIEGEA